MTTGGPVTPLAALAGPPSAQPTQVNVSGASVIKVLQARLSEELNKSAMLEAMLLEAQERERDLARQLHAAVSAGKDSNGQD